MKKFLSIATLFISVFALTSCTERDDEFFANTTLTSNNLINLQVTGNEVNVSCYLARLLPQATNPFDIYLTSNSRKLFFNYTLEKRNSNNEWEFITPSNVTSIAGENSIGDYMSGIAVLDALDTTYEYETDIILTSGQYRITIDPEIVSLEAQNAVMVTVKTTTTGATDNVLSFTVN